MQFEFLASILCGLLCGLFLIAYSFAHICLIVQLNIEVLYSLEQLFAQSRACLW